jgi:predicted small lipoprotein YifL
MKNNQPNHSNNITTTLSRYAYIAIAALGFLTACGQRGSLYLPTSPEAGQRSSIVETLSVPASDTEPKTTSSTRSPMTTPAATK